MNAKLTALALGAALVAGIASSAAASEAMEARETLMKSFGAAAKTLGGMAGGELAYDAAAAEAAKAALIAGAAEIPARFDAALDDPESEAKPEIWTNWDDFLVKAKAMGDAASALDVASAQAIGAGMGAIGGTCKDCHMAYRVMK